MKLKLRTNTSIINAGDSFKVSGFVKTGAGKAQKKYRNSNLEELILSEFNIDFETMEEHFDELNLFMMHQKGKNKLPHN